MNTPKMLVIEDLRSLLQVLGGAAHLPGMVAAKTTLPVIGVPVKTSTLSGLDSLYSIVQMPGGVPVATVAIGTAGAKNAGVLAAQIIGTADLKVAERLANHQQQLKEKVAEMREQLANQ
ncbi:phosphoribosylaminoimidazole carboxylase catalytic subunit [Gracilibacillus boraciitolerans JCM 21714]|uniref:Phosphoribosylaminoimidazole carboxylase catalytic subunit n=1 Tax=Gracilibacillus boraciitolerans JCM 21714 TaxID=1298598 RepID=W4VHV4_9BACI|nr:phosphoribosylaminoimidazole carboxylase catalytic subunit [Gracilibacillus boraciitolerans JCM 21714]